MDEEQLDEHLSRDTIPKTRSLRPLIYALAGLSAVMVWINVSPPSLGPWFDCPIGEYARNMDTRIRLLNRCLTEGQSAGFQRASYHFKRGNAYAALGRQGDAIKDYNEAIRLHHKYQHAYYNRGTSYLDLRNYPKAISDFNVALHLRPSDWAALHNRGLVYFWIGQHDEALRDLSAAIDLNPEHHSALYTRSTIHILNKNYTAAIADMTTAIRINPKLAKYYLERGRANLLNSNLDAAIDDANSAIKSSDVSDSASNAADLRRYYDGFNFYNETFTSKFNEQARPNINKLSKYLLLIAYAKKLESQNAQEIMRVQTALSGYGHYSDPIDGAFHPSMVTAMLACTFARACTLNINSVSGLQ